MALWIASPSAPSARQWRPCPPPLPPPPPPLPLQPAVYKDFLGQGYCRNATGQQAWYVSTACLDTEAECDFLEAIHARHGRSSSRRVLEPACGTGRLLRALTRRGWETTGFDHSEDMLEYARRANRSMPESIRVENARFDDFRFEQRFDLAHCLISSIQHVRSEAEAEAFAKAQLSQHCCNLPISSPS